MKISHNLLTILSLTLSTIIYGQERIKCMNLNYLSDSVTIPDITIGNTNKMIYFVGETHNIGSNFVMHYDLFTSLNRKLGLQYYVREGSYGAIYFMNKYIQTGDDKFIKILGENPSDENEWNEFLKKMFIYNKDLPVGKKIAMIGIDSEPFFYVKEIIEDIVSKRGTPPTQVKNIIDLLISFKSKTNTLIFLTHKEKRAIRSITKEAKVLFETDEKICREYLKEDFIHFQMIIDNNATLSRDERELYLNFLDADNYFSGDQYYIQYGNLHAKKNKENWLANRINQSTRFSGKVASFTTRYYNTTMTWGDNYIKFDSFNELPKNEKNKLIKFIENDIECNFSLHDLSDQSEYFTTYRKAYDYLIIVKNQKGIGQK